MEDLTQEFLAESREGLERMELCLTELEKRPGDGELVAEIFRAVHTIKGTTGFLGFGRLQTLAHAGETLLAAVRDGKVSVTGELISGLLELRDGLQAILQIIETRGNEGERHTDDDGELIAQLQTLQAGGLPQAAQRDAGRPTDAPPISLRVVENPTARDQSSSTEPQPMAGQAQAGTERTLRIDVVVLNRMMDLVGELVLTRNQILQSRPDAESFPELARRLNGVTTELRDSVMEARMQPVGNLFSKFPRMVRDLALTCGRRVRIEFEGQETGLDKSLLEAVRDPLAHAVRNAVDHGIEPPEERVRAGKPAEGVVRLRAFQQGGSVVIEVIDDGAGILTERVLAKAMERGLVTAEQAAAMTERDALQLLFLPGFSTAKEVTSVSGRGVGMDVVRTNVEHAGGRVELESRAGIGTTVRLRVPLTLAIVPALVVESGGQSFALPQSALTELVRVPHADAGVSVEQIGSSELYRLREGVLPLVRLDRLLGIEPDAGAEPRGFYIAVLELERRRFGLVVDALRPPEEIVVKPLSASLRELGVYSGATVLGNGTLAMILDVAAIAARAGVRPSEETRLAAGEAAQAQSPFAMQAEIVMENSMVLYETAARSEDGVMRSTRMAMPMSAVERIATVPVGEIEYVDGRAVVQYDTELLSLEDDGGVLAEMSPRKGATVTVLICLQPTERGVRKMGVVVRRVLDVCAGTVLAEDAAHGGSALAMIQDRVTALHPGFGGFARFAGFAGFDAHAAGTPTGALQGAA